MDARLFGLLSEGQVEEYRAIAHAKRHTRPQLARDKKWGGPVSPKKLGFFQAAEPEHAARQPEFHSARARGDRRTCRPGVIAGRGERGAPVGVVRHHGDSAVEFPSGGRDLGEAWTL
ncbi:hypothetical protein ACFVSQ_25380 [Streptomyces niveus]|uniref:hypothetical protein n=1 Tax=Streptomyces niveus TaxID=193462 RepID=UPI0036E1E6BA